MHGLLLVLGSALFVGVSLLSQRTFDRIKHWRESPKPVTSAQAARGRALRTHAVMDVAPVPPPSALPLVERPGNDDFGYPKSYVDGPGLRSLLHYGRYAELTQYFEEFQRAFEEDPKKEIWPVRAAETFGSAEPQLLPKLEAWAKATPDSFAPYLALGAHWTAVMLARRGSNFASETPKEDFAAMADAAKVARRNLTQALINRPKVLAAHRLMMSMALLNGQRALRDESLKRANLICPACFMARLTYMTGLEPRWGGTFDAMATFAKAAPVAANPRLKLLAGYVDSERADVARTAKQYDDALKAANAACALGPNADFLETRAYVWEALQDLTHARQDLDLAVELRPEVPGIRLARANLLVQTKDWERAAQDLIAVMRVEPTAYGARWAVAQTSTGLDRDGWAAHLRGEHEQAVKLLGLAEALVPFDQNVRAHRASAVRDGVTGTPEELDRLEARIKAEPDSFSAHQALDYALARQQNYPRVLEMWTEYLSRHPDDGNAYFERSGAYFNSKHLPEANLDLNRACDLGVSQACAYLEHLRPSK